jgi:hypothetical protein
VLKIRSHAVSAHYLKPFQTEAGDSVADDATDACKNPHACDCVNPHPESSACPDSHVGWTAAPVSEEEGELMFKRYCNAKVTSGFGSYHVAAPATMQDQHGTSESNTH